MRILLLTTHLNVGGISRYAVSLARGLQELGHSVTVASSGGEWVSSLKEHHISHVLLDLRTKSELSPRIPLAIWKLKKILQEHPIDVIHAQTRVAQVIAAVLSRWTGVPYVTTCHGFYKRRLGRRLFPCWGHRSVAISPVVATHLLEDFHVLKERIRVVFNATEIDRFPVSDKALKERLHLSYGIPADVKVIGSVSRFVRVKGLHVLLEAFVRLKAGFPKTVLVLAGRGEEEESLRRQAKTLGIAPSVYFVGQMTSTEEILPLFDLFVHPALWREGFGLSLIEAMACGIPTVASRVGALDSIVIHEKTGLLTPPGDAEQLSEAIQSLLKDEKRCEQMGLAGRQRVEENFSLDRMVSETSSIYKEVVTQKLLPKRILVVNVNWVGDVLFSTPFLQALRTNFQESYIACLVVSRCQEVLQGNPHLDKLLIYDEKGIHRSFLGKLRLIRLLRRERFDQVYLLHRSFTRRLLTVLAGIPERIGYPVKRGGWLLTGKIPVPPRPLHKVDYFLGLLPPGSRVESRDYTLWVGREDETATERLLVSKGVGKGERFIVFCPFGNWDQKRWPWERFASLGDQLTRRYPQKIVIAGEAKDRPLGEKIAGSMEVKPVLLCGETSLKQLAALFKGATLVVTNDTGPMHVAQSQRAKVIALFGPTDPRLTGPSGTAPKAILRKEVGCNDDPPCYYVDCPDTICMKAIQVEDVLEAIQKES